jgi:hypothetical protein
VKDKLNSDHYIVKANRVEHFSQQMGRCSMVRKAIQGRFRKMQNLPPPSLFCLVIRGGGSVENLNCRLEDVSRAHPTGSWQPGGRKGDGAKRVRCTRSTAQEQASGNGGDWGRFEEVMQEAGARAMGTIWQE